MSPTIHDIWHSTRAQDWSGESQLIPMVGERIERAAVQDLEGNDAVIIETARALYILCHDQDCCESVTLEEGRDQLADLVGGTVRVAEEVHHKSGKPKDELDESFTWTLYRFRTTAGDCTLRFYGTSNGYYSEAVSVRRAEKPIAGVTALDNIEVEVAYGGVPLELTVEITRWSTRATHDHPGDPAEWRCVSEGLEEVWRDSWLTKKLQGAINDQVQEHCAGQAAPGGEE